MNGITFVERIRSLLESKQTNQTKMLKDLGLPKSSIANWEQRGNIPSADIVFKIANYLNVSMEFLLTGEEGKTNRFEHLENLSDEELHEIKFIEMDVNQLKLQDEALLLGNYRLLNANNKNVIQQIVVNLLNSQQ